VDSRRNPQDKQEKKGKANVTVERIYDGAMNEYNLGDFGEFEYMAIFPSNEKRYRKWQGVISIIRKYYIVIEEIDPDEKESQAFVIYKKNLLSFKKLKETSINK